jgi:hypothetical protein
VDGLAETLLKEGPPATVVVLDETVVLVVDGAVVVDPVALPTA